MKNFIIFLLLLFTPCFLSAQYSQPNRIFGKKQINFRVTAGILPTYLADKADVLTLPLGMGVEWFVADNVSLGTYAGYSKSRTVASKDKETQQPTLTNETYNLDARVTFHSTKVDNFDFYGGFSLGYQNVNVKAATKAIQKNLTQHKGIKEKNGGLLYTGFVGMQYAPSKKYTVSAELGYGISIFKIGVGYRIR